MEVATVSSSFALHKRMLATTASSTSLRTCKASISSARVSPSTGFVPSFASGSVSTEFSGVRIRLECISGASVSGFKGKRGVVTMESAWEQSPPDLASYLYKNRIVYLGMSLVPSVSELILAEFLYLQYEYAKKPMYLYIDSTGTAKGGEKLGYETKAFAIYDVMRFQSVQFRYVKPSTFTLCMGDAWGEAALLLEAGAKGSLSASPSLTIMMKQVLYNERSSEDHGVVSDLEKAQLMR